MYVLISKGTVVLMAGAVFPAPAAMQWVNVPAGTIVNVGDTYNGTTFTAPSSILLSVQQKAVAALANGLQIISTGTSALNGIYACDPTTTSEIDAEITSILLNGTFADGTSSLDWPDISNLPHTMTIAQFKMVGGSIGDYVSNLTKCLNGQTTILPPSSITIP